MTSILLTGFGVFEGVDENPSGALARLFDGRGTVRGAVLPVEFRASAATLDEALASGPEPSLILCLGVHPGPGYRLERRAGTTLGLDRPDNAGECGDVVSGEMGGPEGDLVTGLDLDTLLETLSRGGEEAVCISDDAGGYVCERIYRHALVRAGERDAEALFFHVPPLTEEPIEAQAEVLGSLLSALGA
jgi:pyrrolidone-carboxylate peptidase